MRGRCARSQRGESCPASRRPLSLLGHSQLQIMSACESAPVRGGRTGRRLRCRIGAQAGSESGAAPRRHSPAARPVALPVPGRIVRALARPARRAAPHPGGRGSGAACAPPSFSASAICAIAVSAAGRAEVGFSQSRRPCRRQRRRLGRRLHGRPRQHPGIDPAVEDGHVRRIGLHPFDHPLDPAEPAECRQDRLLRLVGHLVQRPLRPPPAPRRLGPAASAHGELLSWLLERRTAQGCALPDPNRHPGVSQDLTAFRAIVGTPQAMERKRRFQLSLE